MKRHADKKDRTRFRPWSPRWKRSEFLQRFLAPGHGNVAKRLCLVPSVHRLHPCALLVIPRKCRTNAVRNTSLHKELPCFHPLSFFSCTRGKCWESFLSRALSGLEVQLAIIFLNVLLHILQQGCSSELYCLKLKNELLTSVHKSACCNIYTGASTCKCGLDFEV